MNEEKLLNELKRMKNSGFWTRGDEEGYGELGYQCAVDEMIDFIKYDRYEAVEE